MVEESTRRRLRALLGKLKSGDGRVPVAELVDLADNSESDLSIDRSSDPTLVYATTRRDPRFDQLSPRELEVAELVASGLSNREIAGRLFISVATVKDHVHAVLSKTGLSSRGEVASVWHSSAGG